MKFRFLDGVVSSTMEGPGKIVTQVTFPKSEDYLGAPFHRPLQVPFTIVLEAMAASGGRLIEVVTQDKAVALMVKVDEANFLTLVSAGDKMLIHSELVGMQDKRGERVGLARTQSQALVADRPVAEARIAFLCLPVKGWR